MNYDKLVKELYVNEKNKEAVNDDISKIDHKIIWTYGITLGIGILLFSIYLLLSNYMTDKLLAGRITILIISLYSSILLIIPSIKSSKHIYWESISDSKYDFIRRNGILRQSVFYTVGFIFLLLSAFLQFAFLFIK